MDEKSAETRLISQGIEPYGTCLIMDASFASWCYLIFIADWVYDGIMVGTRLSCKVQPCWYRNVA